MRRAFNAIGLQTATTSSASPIYALSIIFTSVLYPLTSRSQETLHLLEHPVCCRRVTGIRLDREGLVGTK